MLTEFQKLMYAFGTQLYKIDKVLYDCFDDVFKHSYVSLASYNKETREEIDEIESIAEKYALIELLKIIIRHCDYYYLYRFKWTIERYNKIHNKYNIKNDIPIKKDSVNADIKNRLLELEKLKLDDWRKSNIKEIHEHYWYWIEQLQKNDDCDYTTWVFMYNDTLMFDMFHLSNYGDKEVVNYIFDYIKENNIIENQIDINKNYEIIHPMFKNVNFKFSSNKGGMCYAIYLTAKELQEIYSKIGSKKAKKLNCYNFFSYINSFKKNGLETKFYLYFKE